MKNMPYCRFENTYQGLVECLEDLDLNGGHKHLSESELRYMHRLGELAREIVEYVEMVEGQQQ